MSGHHTHHVEDVNNRKLRTSHSQSADSVQEVKKFSIYSTSWSHSCCPKHHCHIEAGEVGKPSPPKVDAKNPYDWGRKTPSMTLAKARSPMDIMSSTSKNQNGWGRKSSLETTVKVLQATHFNDDDM